MKRLLVASTLAIAVMATLGSTPAAASFFQIAETCPSGLGNAFAGGAAAAEDACTVWFNPAGMTKLDGKELVIGVHLIEPSLEYVDGGSTTFLGTPLLGGDGGDAGDTAIVPNVYYSQKIGSNMAWGIGINAPFGLTTDFEPGWIGRYYALKSEIVTVNINPSFAYQVNPKFSIGVGVNYQTIEAELSQAIDFGSTCVALQIAGTIPFGTCALLGQSPQGNDGIAKVDADDSAFGWNVGFLWEANPNFRVGFSYRSELSFDAEGTSVITTPDPGTAVFAGLIGLGDSGATAAVDLPEIISLSFWWQAATKWEVMADVTQTGWSSLPELRIEFDNSAPDSVVTLNLDDSIKYAIGATYNGGPKWALRFGYAMDETPTPSDEFRTPRLPDEDRTWYTLGFDYDISTNIGLAFSYGLIEIDDARVDKVAVPGGEDFLRGNLQGDFDFGVSILSAQLRWGF